MYKEHVNNVSKKLIWKNSHIKKQDRSTCFIIYIYSLSLTKMNWKTLFTQPIKLTIETKLREFQYEYVMHIVSNNEFLTI